jgi:hypothetical protein
MDDIYTDIQSRFGSEVSLMSTPRYVFTDPQQGNINKRLAEFHKAIENMSSTLNQLYLAQELVQHEFRETVLSEIQNLAEYSLAQLRRVNFVLSRLVDHATSDNSLGPLRFANKIHELLMKTTEEFEKWRGSHTYLSHLFQSQGTPSTKKERKPQKFIAGPVSTTYPEVFNALAKLEATFSSITGFAARLVLDLLPHCDGCQDKQSTSQAEDVLFNDPFAINIEITDGALKVLIRKMAGLEFFLASKFNIQPPSLTPPKD